MEIAKEKARVASAKHLAQHLIKKCKIKEAPVSIQSIISYLQSNQDLAVYPCADFSDKLSAILVTIEDDFSRRDEIYYNQNQSSNRNRFSVAHEIGHLLFNTSHSDFNFDLHNSRSLNEIEANQFAAELLMPSAFLKTDLKKGGLGIKDLALKYRVSENAMAWKVSNSNILARL